MSATATATAPGCDDILDPGEEIVRQGRPDGRLGFAPEIRRRQGKSRKPVGFHRIPEARGVLARMREIRKRQMS